MVSGVNFLYVLTFGFNIFNINYHYLTQIILLVMIFLVKLTLHHNKSTKKSIAKW